MSNYDVNYLGRRAKELGFMRDTLEKATRLADILQYFNTDPLLKENLALKGGTAINMTIFNLPRLSVDLDLDYLGADSKEVMLENRDKVNSVIDRYMASQGYVISPKRKTSHSLDSWVYTYINAGGNPDNIKLEINYSFRAHVLPVKERSIITEYFSCDYKVKTLDPIEIYGSKINALLNRAAARDLYDVMNMIKFGLFDEKEETIMLKKCVIFYASVSAKKINKSFDVKAIDAITKYKIKTDLLPVIKKGDDLDMAKETVVGYVRGLMKLTRDETEFLRRFENKEYVPELLFEDHNILDRVKNHPMALWKTR